MVDKIQFVFCNNIRGHLACENKVQVQPPLGILTLASYIQQVFPEIEIEVFDGKYLSEDEILNSLDADIVGFSTWFSNYDNSISLAEKLREKAPNTTIIFGGPHATAIPKRILINNNFIDYVICGEGEIPFIKIIKGFKPQEIPGLFYREKKEIAGNNLWETIDLDFLPLINLELLQPKYVWLGDRNSPAMSAFPLSGIRGCMRGRNRCEYCSIPIKGYRCVSPQKYWEQVNKLNADYGVNFFFETGDTFPRTYIRELGSVPDHADVVFRIYSYPSTLKNEDVPFLQNMGVRTMYMGVESVLHWEGNTKRRYPSDYSINSLIEEFKMYGQADIDIIPGFLLGLPGENDDSIERNLKLIRRASKLNNVREITVSVILPLPGADYFNWCCMDDYILAKYQEITGDNLQTNDKINYYLLSQLFVEKFTDIGYEKLHYIVQNLKGELGSGMANWGAEKPLLMNK